MQDGGRIRLLWMVDSSGYALDERVAQGSTFLTERPAGIYIVPRGGKPRVKEIRMDQVDVLVGLANVRTPEDARAFATKWGLPHQSYEQRPKSGSSHDMSVESFLEISERLRAPDTEMRKLIKRDTDLDAIFCDLYDDGSAEAAGKFDRSFANLRAVLHKGQLVLRPFDLEQLCWMQRLDALISGGADVSRCLACGTFIAHNHKQGRPKDYCSDACKYRQWRKNKKRKRAS